MRNIGKTCGGSEEVTHKLTSKERREEFISKKEEEKKENIFEHLRTSSNIFEHRTKVSQCIIHNIHIIHSTKGQGIGIVSSVHLYECVLKTSRRPRFAFSDLMPCPSGDSWDRYMAMAATTLFVCFPSSSFFSFMMVVGY